MTKQELAEIETIRVKIYGLQIEIEKLNQALKSLDHDPEVVRIEKETTGITNKVFAYKNELDSLEHYAPEVDAQLTVYNCQDKMKTLDLKDPACQSSTCSVILSAIEAKKLLPQLEEALAKIVADKKNRQNTIIAELIQLDEKLNQACMELDARETFLKEKRGELAASLKITQEDLLAAQTILIGKTKSLTDDHLRLKTLRTELAQVKLTTNYPGTNRLNGNPRRDMEELNTCPIPGCSVLLRGKQVYCSDKCRMLAYRMREAARISDEVRKEVYELLIRKLKQEV